MAQCVGTEVPPTVHPASALQGALLTHVDWHATAMREAACVPMVQCVGTEVPPTVCPASALQDSLLTHVDCHAAAMRDAACLPMAQCVGTEVPPTVRPASALQDPLSTQVGCHVTATCAKRRAFRWCSASGLKSLPQCARRARCKTLCRHKRPRPRPELPYSASWLSHFHRDGLGISCGRDFSPDEGGCQSASGFPFRDCMTS